MKTSFAVRAVASTLLLVFAASVPAVEWLRTEGQDIVDARGRKVLLRGVGLGNWMLPEGYMWKFGAEGDRPRKIERLVADLLGPEAAARFWTEFRQQYITEADVQRIAALGFNSVRPALNARLFLTETDPPVPVEEGFQLLDNLVGWCRKAGIYVIIDMHGAPGGQTGANIDDSPRDRPELFEDQGNQDRLVDLWVKLARKYRDEPAVAAYDLLNEPLPARTGALEKHRRQLEPLYRRITAAIRQVDPKHIITLEGGDWANDWSVFSRRFDENLLYQFHYYCWDQPTLLQNIDRFLRERQRLGAPVWVGETGEKDNTIYWGTTAYFEANNIGWSFWPWKKMDTRNTPYSIKAPAGWDAIRAYSRGEGAAPPPRAAAQKAFDVLLENIRLENCVFFPDVVNAIFRRVPGKVEAENYDFDGAGKSYFVKDTERRSKFYRTSEPVPVEPLEPNAGRRRSEQAILLQAGEWTAYTANSLTAASYAPVLQVKAASQPAAIELSVNGRAFSAGVPDGSWAEIKLPAAAFTNGPNRLKLSVTTGAVRIDFLRFD